MGNYLDPNNAGYAQLRYGSVFVDKTGLLRFTNERLARVKRFLCVSRPRGFGKTLDAEMITSYYSCACDSSSLFAGLNISTSPDYLQHLNKYHVVRFSMLSLDAMLQDHQTRQKLSQHWKGTDWLSMDLIDYINLILDEELQEAFPQCLNMDFSIVEKLNYINKTYRDHPQFIIIIDEWDYVFRKYPDQTKLQEEYVSFLTTMFKNSISCDCILLAYLTGIYPIKKYGLQAALDFFSEFTMIHPRTLKEYMGFTEDEVAALCTRSGQSLEDMKAWYEGYHLKDTFSVYCPASVASAVEYREICSYWSHTESYDDIRKYIELDIIGLRTAIAQLLRNEPLVCKTSRFSNDIGEPKTRDELLTMLVHLGFLTCVKTTGDTSQLAIPNQEIQDQFEQNTGDQKWLRIFQILDNSATLLRNTWDGDCIKVAAGIEAAHFDLTAAQNYDVGEALQCVVLTAYQAARAFYDLQIEPNMGVGRADIFFEPLLQPDSEPAIPMLVELKWNKTADSTIKQIKDKQYARSLSKWHDMLLVGINYDTESRVHTCVIEHHYPNSL